MSDKAVSLCEELAPDDPTPLPLIVARKWGFPLQHHIIEGQYWYAIPDWIAGLATEESARKVTFTWSKMRKGALISVAKLSYIARNGKTYQTDFTDERGLYFIVSHLRSTKRRFTIDEVTYFLMCFRLFVDENERDFNSNVISFSPEKSPFGINEKRHLHPAVGNWLIEHDYHYSYEVKMPEYGRADFVARQDNFGAVVIVECKVNLDRSSGRVCAQVKDYCRQYGHGSKPVLATPLGGVTDQAREILRQNEVALIEVEILR